MAFNLPSAQYLMRTNASTNRGFFDNEFQTGNKTGGNLPITFSAPQLTNSGGNEGIYFGLDSQNSTTNFDASSNTKVMLTSVQFNAPNRIQVGTKAQRGVVARLTSGSGGSDYREFVIGGNDTPFASSQAGPVTICLDLSSASNDSGGGSYDNSSVTGWGYGTFKTNLAGGNSSVSYFQRVFLLDTGKGEPNLPTFTSNSNFDDAVAVVLGSDYTDKIGFWCSKSGSAIFLPVPFSIGDGSSATNFNDNGATIVSPSDNSQGQENFRLTDNSMRVYLDTRDNSADLVTLTGSYSWGTASPWDFDVSNSSTCELAGNFVGMGDFTLGTSVTASGNFNLASGASVICNSANINNINVSGSVNLIGDTVTNFVGVTAGELIFDTAGTYNLNGCFIGQVTSSVSGVIINSINTVISTNNNPSNVTISTSTSFAATGLQQNSEVRIYIAGTTTEIAGVESTSGTYTTTLGVSAIDLVVINLEYLAIKIKGIDTTTDTAIPIQQVFDRQYQND